MANKAISELPQAQNVNNQDLFVLEQSGIAKKLTAETFITEQGIIDALAEALDGHGGIQSVTLASVSGRIRTYRITFSDGSATTFQVYDGTSIDRISRTSSSGLDDVYTIFLSDGTTTFFTVHNGADGTVSEAMLNDALKDKAPAITETTESSAIATFSDGADDMPLHNILAEINPVQDLPYGDPYPAGSGKNKLQVTATSGVVNGVTITVNDDGSIKLVGTATANLTILLNENLSLESASWIFSGEGFGSLTGLNGGVFASSGTEATGDAIYNKRDGDYSFSGTVGRIWLYFNNGTVFNNTLKLMIRPSSIADSSFAPYSNICPITGHTEVNVTRTGVNIWDEEWELGYIAPSTGAKMDATNRIRSKNYIPVVGGQSYFIKMYGAAACYDRNKSYISSVPYTTIPSVGYALNIPENARYILFSMSATYGATYNHDISINYPSSDYDYHAYQGSNTVTVDWSTEAGTVYGGTIDVATGLLTVEYARYKFTGTESLYAQVSSSRVAIKTGMVWKSTEIGWCSDFKFYATAATNFFYLDTTMPAEDVKTYMANHDVYAVGVLATPQQTYQLTPQEVKTLLGTNNVWADTGDTSVTYTADTKLYIEKLTMPTEDDLVANQAITSGKYFMIGNSLYLALANIASGAQITIGTNAQRVSLADALNTINS